MRRRLLLISHRASLVLAAPAQRAAADALAGRHLRRRASSSRRTGPSRSTSSRGRGPAGTTTLAPVLSNETLTGTETLTAMQRRIATTADERGRQRRLLHVRARACRAASSCATARWRARPPASARARACSRDGTLDIRRVSFVGTWQGAGARADADEVQPAVPRQRDRALHRRLGPDDPRRRGRDGRGPVPLPGRRSRTPTSPRRSSRCAPSGGAVPIPPGGAVLLARGAAAAALSAEAPVGSAGDDAPALQARLAERRRRDRRRAADRARRRRRVPGGRGSSRRASSAPRAPRSAIGQLADGRIVLVAVDGRQPGYSVGMTNFELAQTLVRLGAVTGMAFDSGGSTTMAFDGTLLNRPSGARASDLDGARVPVPGVYVQPAVAVVSPDGDGVADQQTLRYKLVQRLDRDRAADGARRDDRLRGDRRRSSRGATGRVPAGLAAGDAAADTRRRRRRLRRRPPPTHPGSRRRAPAGRLEPDASAARRSACAGQVELTVSATDDVGQPSEMAQTFLVNSTVGFLATGPKKLFLPPTAATSGSGGGRRRPPRVVVTVETRAGEVVRTLARRRYAPGRRASPGTASTARRRRSRAAGTSSASWRRTRSGRSSSASHPRATDRRRRSAELPSRVP